MSDRFRHEFMLTGNVAYMCKYCGLWQCISSWEWLALLACKLHERKCEGRFK